LARFQNLIIVITWFKRCRRGLHPTEKENKKHKKYFLDLSVECNIGKTDSKVYIVFEHKSYYDKLTLIQILNYCLSIWESKKEIITLEDGRVIRLFEYIVVNNDIQEEDFLRYLEKSSNNK